MVTSKDGLLHALFNVLVFRRRYYLKNDHYTHTKIKKFYQEIEKIVAKNCSLWLFTTFVVNYENVCLCTSYCWYEKEFVWSATFKMKLRLLFKSTRNLHERAIMCDYHRTVQHKITDTFNTQKHFFISVKMSCLY